MLVSNILHTLDRLGISSKSSITAIHDVGTMIRDGVLMPEQVVDKIIGITPTYDNDVEGRIAVQALVEHIVKNKLDQFDTIEVLKAADVRVAGLRVAHPELFNIPEGKQKPKADEVIIKDDGSIKKGGKQLLAKKLYKERFHGKEFANKDLVEALIKECDLTKAGANTYSYNLRKQIAGWETE